MTSRKGRSNVVDLKRRRASSAPKFRRLSQDEADVLGVLTSRARRLTRVHPDEDLNATRRMMALIREWWSRIKTRDELLERITIKPTVSNGYPVVYGTKIRVWVILDALVDGDIDKVLRQYPVLSYNDIRAAIAFACEVLKAEFDYEEEGQETNPKGDA